MLSKLFAAAAIAIAAITLTAGFTQQAALVLRQENQDNYWPRYDTQSSGTYRSGVWVSSPLRSSYGSFRGGGPGAGK
ncbi:MAG: hypothetical protein IGS48_16510 [Oscillatoriales cyanobacterium C42_A2020_001]|nr:hypothetical protein [Leptolyngbyaceae cyanobacterium C42_A2020_001]